MSEKPKLRDGVIRRGSKWAYVIRVTDTNGISKPKWVSGFATETEAKAARDQARVDARRCEFVHRSDVTVEQYLRTWLTGHALEVKPKTLEDYRSLIERYVVPRLGRLRLQAVRPATLSTLYANLLHEGGHDGGALSSRTVNYVHSVLRKALNDAVHVEQLIPVNPALRAKRPKVDAVHPVHTMWGTEELRRFLDALNEHRLFPFFRLSAYTGARRGELFYLTWLDVQSTILTRTSGSPDRQQSCADTGSKEQPRRAEHVASASTPAPERRCGHMPRRRLLNDHSSGPAGQTTTRCSGWRWAGRYRPTCPAKSCEPPSDHSTRTGRH